MGVQEGTISVDGYQVWYRRVGSGGIPLLLLHGGPGAGHDYLESLEALAADRMTVFYDQLGCGSSDQPDDRPCGGWSGLWLRSTTCDVPSTCSRCTFCGSTAVVGSPSSICSRIHPVWSVWCWPAPRPAFLSLLPKQRA